MDIKKILILLIALIIYTNYVNYMKNDTSKQLREIATLQANIKREIDIQKAKYTKETLALKQNSIGFDGKKYSYSKAMGAMQDIINNSAKNICNVKRIKWAQVPSTKAGYDKLRMDVYLSCTPKNLFRFTNKFISQKNIFIIENIRMTKDRNQELLNINMQLVAFRIHK